jgi:ABC-2 type transport system permease protein
VSVHGVRYARQILAFARKEIAEVVRQPRLLFVMVLGPFAVMAAFGLGYQDEPPALRAVFVMPADSPLRAQVDAYADQIGEFVDFRGVAEDRAAADRQLAKGDIDVIVDFPPDPLATVLSGERAVVTVVHTRLDPIDRTAISFVSSLAIDQINSEVLAQIVSRGQGLGGSGSGLLTAAQANIGVLRAAIASNDQAAAEAAAADLDDQAGGVAVAAELSGSVTRQLGGTSDLGGLADDLRATMADLRTQLPAIGSGDATAVTATLDRLDQLLADGSAGYAEALSVDPKVLVRPLDREVQLAVDELTDVTDWYAPAAVMLMLQQFGVAFGAMAFVRERQLGIDDVFRIAPVGATGSLVGKYVAYLVIGSVVAATLAALVVFGLDVPVTGGIGDVATVMALTLFASIGLGFVVSLISRSDAQAVQYTMIILLASLFFSGFFLSIGQMRDPVPWISFLLPVTAGMRLLRDVMLRGATLDLDVVGALAAYGVVLFVVAYLGVRHRIAPRATRPLVRSAPEVGLA